MAIPVLIDTDMGIDDAVAIALALAAVELDVVGMVSVGGNVALEQATRNIGRLLSGLGLTKWPAVGRGLDQDGQLSDAAHVFNADGLGGVDLVEPADFAPEDYRTVYERAIRTHGEALCIVAIGPLTNLAAVMREMPEVLARVGRIIVMGGAVWCRGNMTRWAEFNFYRDPEAAAAMLASGLPITVVPLDVTQQVAIDDSHVAHLARSGTRAGPLLARMIRWPLDNHHAEGSGRFLVHDALAVGVLLWPEMFLQARMALEVTTGGEQVGRSRPAVARDRKRQLGVVTAVNTVDFLENLIETLCDEKFVV